MTLGRWGLVSALLMLAGGVARAESGAAASPKLARATFAGGCFWCMEAPFDRLDGVRSTTSGYTGGTEDNPTYERVSGGLTGHAEAIEILYDPQRVSYERLLEVFWHNIDPLTAGAQFCDRGSQYRSAVFFHNEEQKRQAEESKRRHQEHFGQPVATQVVPASRFYPAEEYHQDYYRKNPARYRLYRMGCGRDRRLEALWGERAGH